MTKEQEYLWVPYLPDHWQSILISANGAYKNVRFNRVEGDWKVAMGTNFFIVVGVLRAELLAHQVPMVSAFFLYP